MEEEIFDENEIKGLMEKYPSKASSLIPLLQTCQEKYGYLPRQVMESIAEYLDMPESRVYGVSTFYAQFRFDPLGEHMVKV